MYNSTRYNCPAVVMGFATINQTENWTGDSCASDRPYQLDLVNQCDCGDNYYGNGESSARDLLLRSWCDDI